VLQIGYDDSTAAVDDRDYVGGDIVLKETVTPLPSALGPDDPLPDRYAGGQPLVATQWPDPASGNAGALTVKPTYLSAEQLNAAGLSAVDIYTNLRFETEPDAVLDLPANGRFRVKARTILHQGEVLVPSGTALMEIQDNTTSFDTFFATGGENPRFIPFTKAERLVLAEGSRIETAGEQIDNSFVGRGAMPPLRTGFTGGGTVSLKDGTRAGHGILMQRGAVVDVNGGYELAPGAQQVQGGDAGSVEFVGLRMRLDGEITGTSLTESRGGSLLVHTGDIRLVPAGSPVMLQDQATTLVLEDGRFQDSGFSDITLKAENDLVVMRGAHLSPSRTKEVATLSDRAVWSGGAVLNNESWAADARAAAPGRVTVAPEFMEGTSVSVTAGDVISRTLVNNDDRNLDARVLVEDGAEVEVCPGGRIDLTAPRVEVAGVLRAPAGQVSGSATDHALVLQEGGRILAGGTSVPGRVSAVRHLPASPDTLPGGSVSLEAADGDVILAAGSVVDVSGAGPSAHPLPRVDGTLAAAITAGDPGSLAITGLGELVLAGTLQAGPAVEGGIGGTLNVLRTDLQDGLALSSGQLHRFTEAGFDDLTFGSRHALELSGTRDVRVARHLTLDAPQIRGADGARLSLDAPWMSVRNTSEYLAAGDPSPGSADLRLSGTWLDVEGGVRLNGFRAVRLEAERDMTLTERVYVPDGSARVWQGLLETAAPLTLQAACIYPTTLSDFTIRSVQAAGAPETASGGKVTILPVRNAEIGTLYSAGGTLTVESARIDHRGVLAAPMGRVALCGGSEPGAAGTDSTDVTLLPAERVDVRDGSRILTAGPCADGASLPLAYGEFNEDGTLWYIQDKTLTDAQVPVEGPPEKAVRIQGQEVVIAQGSDIDVSGGGSVFAHHFLPGIEGTLDPLKVPGRYVILPAGTAQLPGKAVTLEGAEGLPAGTYALLPEAYAFLPGAVVIQELDLQAGAGNRVVSPEGYPVVAGTAAVMGTELGSPERTYYAYRPAEAVLREGNFTTAAHVAGDSGDVSVSGETTLLDGRIHGEALEGFQGGMLALSGRQVLYGPEKPGDLGGMLYIDSRTFTAGGFETVQIGRTESTDWVHMTERSVLEAAGLTLSARDEIRVEAGAEIHASDAVTLETDGGRIAVAEGARVHAADELTFDAHELDLQGDFQVDNSSLNFQGERIYVDADSGGAEPDDGLVLDQAIWQKFADMETVALTGRQEILFLSSLDLAAGETLRIDTARVGAAAGEDPAHVSVRAGKIEFTNTGDVQAEPLLDEHGSLSFQADEMVVGRGDVLLDGFETVALHVENDLSLRGQGSLSTGGDLDITAARVTTTFDAEGEYAYPDFLLSAPDGDIRIRPSGAAAGPEGVHGGRVEIRGRCVHLDGTVEVPSGAVALTALGGGEGDGVFLGEGAVVRARGGTVSSGGQVALCAELGRVSVAEGARVDVSAGGQGDAGSVTLHAPVGGVDLRGQPAGHAGAGGQGGSLVLDTTQVNDFADMNTRLREGGFDHEIDVRARQGDVLVPAGEAVSAERFRLVADQGRIDLNGTVASPDVSEDNRVEICAGGDLTLASGSRIHAPAGEVSLASAQGTIDFEAGAHIELSGSQEQEGGTLHFRAERDGTSVAVNLEGTVTGASDIAAEAVQVYEASDTSAAETWWSHAVAFLDGTDWDPGLEGVALLPGIEVQSDGDLTVTSDVDLASWRASGRGGVLALRAGGDLLADHSVVDGTSDSWSLLLTAGADLQSADPLAVRTGQGDLQVADERVLFTRDAPIRLAAGRDVSVGTVSETSAYAMTDGRVPFNVGSEHGSIRGRAGRDLVLGGGVIQTLTGDVEMEVGRDLLLENRASALGTVRTLGEIPEGYDRSAYGGLEPFWDHADGGDIDLRVGGDLRGLFASGAWDHAYSYRYKGPDPDRRDVLVWAASYQGRGATQGVAAMGGGDLNIRATGDVAGLQAGTFGTGDLDVFAGGDLDGRFLVRDGTGTLATMGNFGSRTDGLALEAFSTRYALTAQGSISLGTVLNPTITRQGFVLPREWNLTYGLDAGVALEAKHGDVTLTGASRFHDGFLAGRALRYLPPDLAVRAAGDIRLTEEFFLTPSQAGNLLLEAGGSIDGGFLRGIGANAVPARARVEMSDMDPATLYGDHWGAHGTQTRQEIMNRFGGYTHARVPVHPDAAEPVRIRAGEEIREIAFYLPKAAEILAGGDILNIYYNGQNTSRDDVTRIRAAGDILILPTQKDIQNQNKLGIEHGGPGFLLVQAGNTIDLGSSLGIQSVGNYYNTSLDFQGSSLAVAAGYGLDRPEQEGGSLVDDLPAVFDALRKEGVAYSRLLAEGRSDEALETVARAREEVVEPFFRGAGTGEGTISLVDSQINCSGDSSDLYLVARGDVDVGRTTFALPGESAGNSGLFTAAGGDIDVFAGGDLNVNESRLMTFRGGDITVWSDRGNINAGRGSKTAINAEPPKLVRDGEGNIIGVQFQPPAVGSGIRTLTYDPDGLEGAAREPEPGNVFLFAPQGEIDAGEAGISGATVVLGATSIVNVQNISFSQGSVGVPAASEGSVGMGAVAGTGGFADAGRVAEQSTALASAGKRFRGDDELDRALSPRWLDVKVLEFTEAASEREPASPREEREDEED